MMKWLSALMMILALSACAQKETAPAAAPPSGNTKAPDEKAGSVKEATKSSKESAIAPRGIDFGAKLEDIAFSCCADQDAPESIWKTINRHEPDLFLFLGNTIYLKADEKSVAAQYRKLHHISEYREIREKVPFMVTWDKEYNDGDETSKKDFLHQWTYIQDSLAMGQSGIYHAKIIGPKKKQVQIIMLDTRSFATPFTKGENFNPEAPVYLPSTDPNATILGAEQWSWLEEQLRRPAQVRIIVSALPIIPTKTLMVKWGNFPLERQRLLDLIKRTQAHNLILVSGHHEVGAISQAEIKGWGNLYEVTAGPMNLPVHDNEKDPAFIDKGIGAQNFGMIHIDWNRHNMKFEIRNESDKVSSTGSINLR